MTDMPECTQLCMSMSWCLLHMYSCIFVFHQWQMFVPLYGVAPLHEQPKLLQWQYTYVCTCVGGLYRYDMFHESVRVH